MDEAERFNRVVWTDADFETMGWHDATIHAVGFQHEGDSAQLLLDLDYIIRWIEPAPPTEHYSFLIAPATLVFENVWDVEGDITAERTLLVIADLERTGPEDDRQENLGLQRWTVHGHNLALSFLASGFRQHIRRAATHVTHAQRLRGDERGGINFEQPRGLPL